MISESRAKSIACGLRCKRLYFIVGEDAGGLFGGVKDAIYDRVVRGNAVAFEPEQDVGFAAHGTNLDDLIQAEQM